MQKYKMIVVSVLILLGGNTLLKASPYALVAGYNSDNIVRFNLADGSSEVVVQLEDTARLRGVAVDSQGDIYVGLRGLSQNVKRFTSNGTFVGDFTASIGGYGTGQIAFHDSGDLIVAGDISFNDSILRYNTLGNLVDTFNISGATNNVAMTVDGDYVYSAAYFSGKIAKYNLAESPVTGTIIIDGTELDSPSGITVGHNGNLFISCNGTGLIQEFDAATNAFIGTFVNVSSFGEQSTLKDVYFDGITGHYFFTADSRLYEIDSNAQLIDVYANYGILNGAGSIVVVPEPATLVGDFNLDGNVDGIDFAHWQIGYPTPTGAVLWDGDADGDGDVDGTDFGIWQANYPTNVGGAATIPEPATLGLMLIGGLVLLRRRK